jgi:hypothetical protein
MKQQKSLFCLLALAVSVIGAVAQDSEYYKAIQKGSPTQISPKQFKQMEQDALKNYSQPETYEVLATTFASTTERVWAVVYGEVYCNLSSDAERSKKIGALVYESYAKSLTTKSSGLSINLTENAQASGQQPPFESQFEMAFLMGAVPLGSDASPLSIKKLISIRKNQLSLWKQKKLPETELTRRQQAILSAGHFDSYNYWLFQGARPDEYSQWLAEHQSDFQSWRDWQDKNKFAVERPDFQRLYFLKR